MRRYKYLPFQQTSDTNQTACQLLESHGLVFLLQTLQCYVKSQFKMLDQQDLRAGTGIQMRESVHLPPDTKANVCLVNGQNQSISLRTSFWKNRSVLAKCSRLVFNTEDKLWMQFLQVSSQSFYFLPCVGWSVHCNHFGKDSKSLHLGPNSCQYFGDLCEHREEREMMTFIQWTKLLIIRLVVSMVTRSWLFHLK